jgi:long-chain fatty acid transport protein
MKRLLFTVALILSARTAFGHGIVLINQDADAVARGTAFVATADNPSAIYYNPAGITHLTGHELRLGVYAVTYQVDYESPAGSGSRSQRGYFPIPQFFHTFAPTNWPVAFGLGVYAPFGLSMKWPQDTGFRSVALEGDLKFLTLQPVIAWRAHPTLSLGIGPTFNYARTDLKQGLSPVPGNDSFRFKGDGFAVGFTTGIRWQPVEQHAFGVVYRSATTVDYDGHTETMSRAPAFSLRESARAEFEFPQSVTVGWSWRPTPDWNFEFNANWTAWDSFDVVNIRQATPVPPLVLGWRSSWYYAWGATRKFGDGWHASAGYIFSENSVPDAHYNPLVADADRHS